MANGKNATESQQEQEANSNDQKEEDPNASSDENSDNESESSYESSYDDADFEGADTGDDALAYKRYREEKEKAANTPEANFELFSEALDDKRGKIIDKQEDERVLRHLQAFDFPKDPEDWKEEDLGEYWANGSLDIGGTGWDPVWADEEEWDYVKQEIAAGRKPPIAPFYVPFYKHNPVIPEQYFDMKTPKAVIEELDRIEEFLKWVSYIFPDGSSYV